MSEECTLPQPALSQPARIANVFVSPAGAFTGLDRNASWWLAFVLSCVVSLGYFCTFEAKIGVAKTLSAQMSRNPQYAARVAKTSPEAQAREMEIWAKARRVGMLCAIPGELSFLLIGAAVLMATFNLGLGAQVRFGVAMAIVVYGNLPDIIRQGVGALLLWAGVKPEGFRNPLPSSLGVLVPVAQHRFLHRFLSVFDVFSLWAVVLIVLGFSIQGRVKRSTAIVIVLGWFLLYKLTFAGALALQAHLLRLRS